MPTTTTWNIDYPDSSSAITPLEGHFEGLATSADEALTNLKANIRGSNSTSTIATLATDIGTIQSKLAVSVLTGTVAPTSTPTEGSLYYESTNDIMHVYSGGNWYPVGAKMPSFIGKLAGTSSTSDGVKKTITFDSKVERGITESSGIITVSHEGWYSVNGQASWASAAAGTRELIIATGVSGTYTEQTINRAHMTATGSFYLNVSAQVYLSAGNTIRLQAAQYTGTVNLTGAVIPCSLTVNYMGM